ncbi:MAG: TetR/AcrR family transcriptional regulator [Eubacterium sp.]
MEYKKSKETRDKILALAKTSFYEIGFKKTTIRGIAKKAEINHALAYYHFKGKYDIAHLIVDEFHQKSEAAFNTAMKDNLEMEDPLLRLMTLYRFGLREIYSNDRDFEFYVQVYQESYYDADLVESCVKIMNYYQFEPNHKKIDIAVLSTSSSWGQLYTNEAVPYREHFTHDDIMDSIDIMRFTYLGFDRDYIVKKIERAREILETLPMMNIRLLEK